MAEETPSGSKGALSKGATSDLGASEYRVELPVFEGPLDLLLHLIQQHELDILNIPISFITDKYLKYLTMLEELNIDVASEYLLMAATLTHIKSRTLLPTPPEEQAEGEEAEQDPRAELIHRLLEYQKYKHAAEALEQREWLGRDVYSRGAATPGSEGPAPLAPVSLFKLLDAFQALLSRAKTTLDHQIDLERFSITDRINQLSALLQERVRAEFAELFEGQTSRAELIVTFLALLEMTRLRMTRLFQEGPYDPIFIELAVQEATEVEPDRLSGSPTELLADTEPTDSSTRFEPVEGSESGHAAPEGLMEGDSRAEPVMAEESPPEIEPLQSDRESNKG